MVRNETIMYFRLFGWPHHVHLHQYVALLRSQELPFKVYCTSCIVTAFYSRYHGAATLLCALSPQRQSYLNMWQLADAIEAGEGCGGCTRKAPQTHRMRSHKSNHDHAQTRTDAGLPAVVRRERPRQSVLLNKHSHPHLHLVCWSTTVYASWWLGKTGHLYRYYYGDTVSFVESLMKFFFHTTFGLHRLVAQLFRSYVLDMFATSGVNDKTADFMREHFDKLCGALDRHLSSQDGTRFVLGTRHVTLADIAVGASFSCFFLAESSCAEGVLNGYPALVDYVARVTGWQRNDATPSPTPEHRGGAGRSDRTDTDVNDDEEQEDIFPDSVPESLREFLTLQAEVLPFMVSQCAAFNAYLQSDEVQRIPLVELGGSWTGCQGRILDRLTKAKSLMIVDDQVMTVCSRTTDLEIAFRAGSEVFDDEGDDTESAARDARQRRPSDAIEANGRERQVLVRPQNALDEVSSSGAEAANANGVDRLCTHATSSGRAESACFAPAADTGVDAMMSEEDRLLALSDWADYYRVYTSHGLSRARRTPGSVGFDEMKGVMYSYGSALLVPPSLLEQMDTLRSLLGQMRSPHYTLAAVTHQGRSCFAVIPEHEAAKVRQRNKGERSRREHGRTEGQEETRVSGHYRACDAVSQVMVS